MSDARRLIDKLIAYRNVLRDAGVGVIEYTEQLTYLLFLKMAHERATRKLAPQVIVPEEYSWQRLLDADGQELETVYSQILAGLASQPGTLGTIFRKSQNRVQDPALLKKLVVDLIGQENWSAGGTNFTGDVYEELLSKGASDQGSGAGQYFTPRELIKAIVEVVQPTPKDSVVDPACGTGGFLLFAHEYAARDAEKLTPPERDHLRDSFAHGFDISDGTARLAAMNLMLHGIGTPDGESLIEVRDALIADPDKRWPVVLTNPPFGKKSSITMVGADGREARDDAEIERQDFVVTTANKQMNFLQHIMTILDINGRAAVVMPDNVLFEGGVGETLRKRLLRDFDFHTMIRLPTGIWYAAGVKANVLSSSTRSPPPRRRGPRSCGSTTSAPTGTSPSSRSRCVALTSTNSLTSTTQTIAMPVRTAARIAAGGRSPTTSCWRATRLTSTSPNSATSHLKTSTVFPLLKSSLVRLSKTSPQPLRSSRLWRPPWKHPPLAPLTSSKANDGQRWGTAATVHYLGAGR